ncbi:MAG: hypothetical protein ABUT20_62585 [Bacteroidota bacterium]
MKFKLLICLAIDCLIPMVTSAQPKITDFKKNKEVYLCLFVSLKDTVNFNNNVNFFGILESDIFFKKFINKYEFSPTFYSYSQCQEIEKKIENNIIVEIPDLQIYTYAKLINEGLEIPAHLKINKNDLYEADSIIQTNITLGQFVDSYDINDIGCFVKVSALKANYIVTETSNKLGLLYPYRVMDTDKSLLKINKYKSWKSNVKYFKNDNKIGLLTKYKPK